MKSFLLIPTLLAATQLAAAQKLPARKTPARPPVKTTAKTPVRPVGVQPAFTLSCTTEQPASSLQKMTCETRALTLPAPPAGTPLTVDARTNGGITVRAWPGSDVRVLARVTGRAATPEAARALAAAVRLSTAGHTLQAGLGSGSADGWAVSYEVLVPAQTDLVLRAVNGALELENVRGKLRFETTNGALVLRGVGGDVQGRTTNGPIGLILEGPAWTGPGLDVSTVNGAIDWLLPTDYTATVLARSTRGRVTAELNTKRLNLLPHNLVATLGKGGAQLKAGTVNGDVRVTQPHPVATPDSVDSE